MRGRWTTIVGVGLAAALAALVWTAWPGETRPNVLLITIDTLRADRVSAFGGPPGLTPHLDRLAARGTRFTAAYTTVPLTLPAHVSMFSGQLPAAHTVRTNDGRAVPEGLPLVAERLRGAGYQTGAFVGAYVLRAETGIARGFDHFDEDFGGRAERRAGEVVEAAIAWIRQTEAPFHAWVHLFDPHLDYDAPEPFRTQYADRPYDGEVAYTDNAIGQLLDALETEAPNTIVVVLSDHGESLGEHGERSHGALLYDGATRVPLIVAVPGGTAGVSTVDAPVSTMLVGATLLRLAGLEPDGFGPPLVNRAGAPAAPDEPVVVETMYLRQVLGWSPLYALRQASDKLIDAPQPELYDLAADPGELANGYDRRADTAAALRVVLTREVTAAATAGLARASATPASGNRALLASLGYVSGGSTPDGFELPAGIDPKSRIAIWVATEQALDLSQRQRAEEAEAAFAQVLADDPGNALALKFLGARALERGERVRAITLHEALVARGLHLADAHANLAIAYLASGRPADALAAADQALALDVRHTGAAVNRAVVLRARGDHAAAAAALDAVIARDPGHPGALALRAEWARPLTPVEEARALVDRGDIAGARAALEAHLRDHDDDAEAHVLLGSVRAGQADLAGARRSFARAVALRPDDPAATERLASVWHQAGDVAQARSLFLRALALDPGRPSAELSLAVMDLEAGQAAEALERLNRVERGWDEAARARCFRGFALADLGDTGAARVALAACQRELPDGDALAGQAQARLAALAVPSSRK